MARENKLRSYSGMERRNAQRLDLPLKLRYRIIGQRRARGETTSINISGGGVRICVGHPLRIGNKLEVSIWIPNIIVIAVGKVVWSRKINGQFEGGLQFIKMRFKSQFTEYLCEQMLDLSFKRRDR